MNAVHPERRRARRPAPCRGSSGIAAASASTYFIPSWSDAASVPAAADDARVTRQLVAGERTAPELLAHRLHEGRDTRIAARLRRALRQGLVARGMLKDLRRDVERRVVVLLDTAIGRTDPRRADRHEHGGRLVVFERDAELDVATEDVINRVLVLLLREPPHRRLGGNERRVASTDGDAPGRTGAASLAVLRLAPCPTRNRERHQSSRSTRREAAS